MVEIFEIVYGENDTALVSLWNKPAGCPSDCRIVSRITSIEEADSICELFNEGAVDVRYQLAGFSHQEEEK